MPQTFLAIAFQEFPSEAEPWVIIQITLRNDGDTRTSFRTRYATREEASKALEELERART